MVIVEWELAAEEDIHDDSGGPDVDLRSRVKSIISTNLRWVRDWTYLPEITSGAA
jgi:hypothetical protein